MPATLDHHYYIPDPAPSPSALDEELVELATQAIAQVIANRHQHDKNKGYQGWMGDARREEARAVLSAIRPKIEAARDERAARIVEGFSTAISLGRFSSLIRDWLIVSARAISR